MSSGKLELNIKIKQNYLSQIDILSEFRLSQNYAKNPKIEELISSKNLFKSDSYNIEKFALTEKNSYNLYYKALRIHLILLNNKNLSNREKLDYCKKERNYIKQFLKEIIKRNYI